MKNCVYWSTWWIKLYPTNTFWNIEHLKIQHLLDNPKNTAAMTSAQKYRFSKFETPKILRWCLSANMPSPPLGIFYEKKKLVTDARTQASNNSFAREGYGQRGLLIPWLSYEVYFSFITIIMQLVLLSSCLLTTCLVSCSSFRVWYIITH